MDESEIVERIVEIATREEEDALLETTAATVHSELYDAAVEAFGGWDGALAATLRRTIDSRGRSGAEEETIARSPGPDAKHPIFGMTLENALFKIDPGTELQLSSEPREFDVAAEDGPLAHLCHVGDPEGLVLFTDRGNYFALSPRMVPKWKGTDGMRRVASLLDLEEGERLVGVLPRRDLYAGRIVHVTRRAKGKASEASEFQYSMDHSPRVAFKVNEGDRPVAVMAVEEGTGIFAASAHGRGIHFPDDELRSMGLRAVGVNVMKLDDDTDAVVGAFSARGVEQVAVLTRAGLGKRVDFDEFRQQGRAGAGMQLCRLDREDAVAGVAPCRPSDDLVVATSAGRVHRRPAGEFAAMGRPAKGDPVVDLADDERVLEFTRLPCSGETPVGG